jgi:hypothetical protein
MTIRDRRIQVLLAALAAIAVIETTGLTGWHDHAGRRSDRSPSR